MYKIFENNEGIEGSKLANLWYADDAVLVPDFKIN